MSDPTRLFDGAGADAERRLIAFARADAPPRGSLGRTLAVVGVAGGVLAPAVSHAAALGTTAGAGAAGTGTTGTSITLAAIAKWLAIGIAGGTLTIAAAKGVERSVSPVPRPAAAPAVSATLEPKLESATPRADPAVAAPTPTDAKAPEPAASKTTRDTLAEELAVLERARRALALGRSDDAREALERHHESFPSAALAEEAEVLRIEVLLLRGEHTLAEQAGRDFLDAHPKSPHAPRVRDLLARAGNDPKRPLRPSPP